MTKPGPLCILIGILVCSNSSALAFDETLEVRSRTLTDEEFLRGDASAGTPVNLSGSLSGPDGKKEMPVVILLHGTDGPGSRAVRNWSHFLNGRGIATFALDSYTARGLSQASADQSRFNQFTQIYDTYRAVEELAAHSTVDGSRVAIMGFSRGGNAALYSAMVRFQKSFGPREGKIVAHLPFYPACNFALVDQLNVASAPIREFHGADDDWTPAAPCRAYIDRLADAGHDAQMTIYPGVLHAFDSGPAHRGADPHWQTSRNCLRREENGQLVANGDINKVAPYPMVTLAPKPGLARVRSMLNAIHHVALICTDYDRSRRFYVELLGLDLIREVYREERQSWKADLRIGSAQLELFSFPAPVMRPSYPEATGLRHLAFTVVNLDPVIMRLEAAGIAVEPIRIDPYTDQRFTFFSDPDGLPLELYEAQ